MTKHTHQGVMYSLWVDDGFGQLTRIDHSALIGRAVTGWMR